MDAIDSIRSEFPREWQIVSDASGRELLEKSAAKRIQQLGGVTATDDSTESLAAKLLGLLRKPVLAKATTHRSSRTGRLWGSLRKAILNGSVERDDAARYPSLFAPPRSRSLVELEISALCRLGIIPEEAELRASRRDFCTAHARAILAASRPPELPPPGCQLPEGGDKYKGFTMAPYSRAASSIESFEVIPRHRRREITLQQLASTIPSKKASTTPAAGASSSHASGGGEAGAVDSAPIDSKSSGDSAAPGAAEPAAASAQSKLDKAADGSASRAGTRAVDNTGNVRVWPAEEALALLLLRWCTTLRGKHVLELGAGKAGTAGLVLASTGCPKRVWLTDGNADAVRALETSLRVGEVLRQRTQRSDDRACVSAGSGASTGTRAGKPATATGAGAVEGKGKCKPEGLSAAGGKHSGMKEAAVGQGPGPSRPSSAADALPSPTSDSHQVHAAGTAAAALPLCTLLDWSQAPLSGSKVESVDAVVTSEAPDGPRPPRGLKAPEAGAATTKAAPRADEAHSSHLPERWLAWGQADLVVGADVTFFESFHGDLARCVTSALRRAPQAAAASATQPGGASSGEGRSGGDGSSGGLIPGMGLLLAPSRGGSLERFVDAVHGGAPGGPSGVAACTVEVVEGSSVPAGGGSDSSDAPWWVRDLAWFLSQWNARQREVLEAAGAEYDAGRHELKAVVIRLV